MDHTDFGLRQEPFETGFDPRFVHLDRSRHDLIAAVLDALGQGTGLVILAGPPRIGKTSVLLRLAEALERSADTALLSPQRVFPCRPATTFNGLVRACRQRLPVSGRGSRQRARTAGDRRQVLLLDDADCLASPVFGRIRLLIDLFAIEGERLSVVAAVEDGAWADGIDATSWHGIRRFALEAMDPHGVADLVRHRLTAAGANTLEVFASPALTRLAEITGGHPGDVVRLAESSLALARREHAVPILPEIVDDAAIRLGFASADTADGRWTTFDLPAWLPPVDRAGPARPDAGPVAAVAADLEIPRVPEAASAACERGQQDERPDRSSAGTAAATGAADEARIPPPPAVAGSRGPAVPELRPGERLARIAVVSGSVLIWIALAALAGLVVILLAGGEGAGQADATAGPATVRAGSAQAASAPAGFKGWQE